MDRMCGDNASIWAGRLLAVIGGSRNGVWAIVREPSENECDLELMGSGCGGARVEGEWLNRSSSGSFLLTPRDFGFPPLLASESVPQYTV